MVNVNDAPASVAARAGLTLPAWGASLPAVGGGHGACAAPRLAPAQRAAEGTRMSRISQPGHGQKSIFGGTSTRKPYNYTTLAVALGGGEPGSHPAREPEPV
jgi:hypothetical protein